MTSSCRLAPVINSLSLNVSGFEGTTIDLDMSGFVVVITCLIISRLALASHISWRPGRTSSLTIWLVGWSLHYILGIVGQIVCEWFVTQTKGGQTSGKVLASTRFGVGVKVRSTIRIDASAFCWNNNNTNIKLVRNLVVLADRARCIFFMRKPIRLPIKGTEGIVNTIVWFS